MFTEKIIGGKFFTLKRTNIEGVDALIVRVTNLNDTIEEVSKVEKSVKVFEEVRTTFVDWDKSVIELGKVFVSHLKKENMIIPLTIDIDLINLEYNPLGFKYEKVINVNDDKTMISLSVNDNTRFKEFITSFVTEYNKLV